MSIAVTGQERREHAFVDASEAVLAKGAVDERKLLNKRVFGALAPGLVDLGWSVFPQESRGERRGPGRVDGRALKWKEFATRRPSRAEVEWWGLDCPSHNVAAIMGKASGEAFALDVDVSDEVLSRTIQALADEHLGVTPFRRVGRAPRILLVYRQAPESEQSADEAIPSKSMRFVQQDAEGNVERSDDQLEILSRGKPATFYGYHHKTGQLFQWTGGKHPARLGPEHAPLVTAAQIMDFLDAVEQVRKFHRNVGAAASDTSWVHDPESALYVPRIKRRDGSAWTENEEGLVVDGREEYLRSLCWNTVRANESHSRDPSRRGRDQIKAWVLEQFKARAVLNGRWTEAKIRYDIDGKVNRAVEECIANDSFMKNPGAARAQTVVPARIQESGTTDDLDFILKQSSHGVGRYRKKVAATFSDPKEAKRAERALVPDRTQIASEVSAAIGAGLDAFFAEVYADGQRGNRIHLLKAPTGAGKTSRTMYYIAQDPRTKKFDLEPGQERAEGEDVPGPVVILLPTYNNIEELRKRADVLNLDKGLSDQELVEQARERNLFGEDEIEARLSDMRREAMSAGLRTMVYRGKAAAGCKMIDKLSLLTEAGIGSAGLCKATVTNDDDEREERFCEFYHGCPAIEQRKEIKRAHVVFMPHAFLTLNVPEELQNPRCVIADERVFHMFLHTTAFHLNTLKRERREPRLTKKEKETGATGQDFLLERNIVANLAYDHLRMGMSCVARRVADYTQTIPNGKAMTGLELVLSAKRVCSHAISSSQMINPDISLDEVKALCEAPTGTEVREELRFWKIIEERIGSLGDVNADLARTAVANGHPEAAERHPPKAKGSRDMRIQFLKEACDDGSRSEKIRISWRSTPNWSSAPLLLLDASADEDITRKIFDGREVVVHDVPAKLNVRTVAVVDATYSNASIVRRGRPGDQERMGAAKVKDKLRRMVSAASALYGFGRVVVGCNAVVRRAINTAWAAPSNVDFCHYGAMRGLDFAKSHVAAVSFGRMEIPVRSVDGLVAALTYDDDEPELPFDVNGDGVDLETGEDLRLPMSDQVLAMRSGGDVTLQVPNYPGRWARKVQAQYREEELKQFLGRLRPVYREGPAPVWIAISKVIPEDVVVDDVVALDDLVKPGRSYLKLWDACRLSGGVIHPKVMAACAPTLYKDDVDAAKDIAKMGFDLETGVLDDRKRNVWGFTSVRVVAPDQRPSYAFVRTDHKDPEAVAASCLGRWLGWEEEDFSVEVEGEPCRPRRDGMRRSEDWLDVELGTPDERSQREADLIQSVAEEALLALPTTSFQAYAGLGGGILPVTLNVPVNGRAVELGMTLSDLASDKSTEMMHMRLLSGHADPESSPVLEPAALYDHLSASDVEDV